MALTLEQQLIIEQLRAIEDRFPPRTDSVETPVWYVLQGYYRSLNEKRQKHRKVGS